jgi:hypothetical protein
MRRTTVGSLIAPSFLVVMLGHVATAHPVSGGGLQDGGRFHGDPGDQASRYRGGGYRRGWYDRRFRSRRGQGGLDHGLFYASLTWYCDTYWWAGAQCYVAYAVYQWNPGASGYEAVPPPIGLVEHTHQRAPRRLFIDSKAGQSNEQQANDPVECSRGAATESRYDPNAAGKPLGREYPAAELSFRRREYLRAERTGLGGGSYSVGRHAK